MKSAIAHLLGIVRLALLCIVAQAMASACGPVSDSNLCDQVRCVGTCDRVRQVCIMDGDVHLEVSAARVSITGADAHLIMADDGLVVVGQNFGDEPPIRFGRLSPDQRETLADWLFSQSPESPEGGGASP